MSWKDLKIAKKLYIGFGIVLVLAVAIGYVGWNGLGTVVQKVENADDANRLVKWVKDTATLRKDFAATKNLENYDQIAATIDRICVQIDSTKARFNDPADIALIDNARAKGLEYLEGWKETIQIQKDIVLAIEQMDAEFLAQEEHTKLRERVGKADDANRLIKDFMLCRIAYRDFRRTEDLKYAEQLFADIDEIVHQCSLSKAKMKVETNAVSHGGRRIEPPG